MAYPSEHYGLCSNGGLRVVLMLVGIFLVGFIMGPRLYSKESSSSTSSAQASCPCDCGCYEGFGLSLPSEFSNISYPDCGKHDPDISEEMEKNMVTLLSEEMNLQRTVANDSLEHTRSLVTEARKTYSIYRNEAEKCNAQTETCEEARERAEAELIEERRISTLWEKRAREFGWTDSRRK